MFQMVQKNWFTWLVLILLVVGGLNWGLVGLFEFDLVAAIFGAMTALSRIVYTIVGICAVIVLVMAMTSCKASESSSQQPSQSEPHPQT